MQMRRSRGYPRWKRNPNQKKDLNKMFCKRFGRHFALLFMLGLCRLASAHPMGNFSVNHYSRIDLQSDRVIVRYFIDLAEIPTYQELQQGNIAATPIDPNSAAVAHYVAARGAELGHGLTLDIDGTQIPMRLVSSGVIFPPGAGGLPTMKMGFVYEAVYPPASSITDRQHATVHYVDNNYPGHSGWKEIVALASAGSLLRTSVPSTDRSGELSNYPTDLLTSPPQCLEASLVAALPPVVDAQSHIISKPLSRRVEASAASATLPQNHPNTVVNAVPAHRQTAAVPVAMSLEPAQSAPATVNTVHLQANRQQTPHSKFTELITAQHLSAWFLFTAAFIAIGLGGLHALEPGHGKTIVAAYLVGSRGTARHAVLLGMIVTIAHTAGVYLLGAITLAASKYVVPDQLYPWLEMLSGITIAFFALFLMIRAWTGEDGGH